MNEHKGLFNVHDLRTPVWRCANGLAEIPIPDAAEYLGVTRAARSRVLKWGRSGSIPIFRTGKLGHCQFLELIG